MRLDTSMSQRMEQKMILAPRMIQSMEILQLPVMALQERIEHELQENPILELKEDNPEENPPAVELAPGWPSPQRGGAARKKTRIGACSPRLPGPSFGPKCFCRIEIGSAACR